MMPTEGYKILDPPPGYAPIRTPARKLMATPTPLGGTPGYAIPEENRGQTFDVPQELEGLPELKPEDHQYFGKLLKEVCVYYIYHARLLRIHMLVASLVGLRHDTFFSHRGLFYYSMKQKASNWAVADCGSEAMATMHICQWRAGDLLAGNLVVSCTRVTW